MKCCGPRPPGFELSTKRWPCDGGALFSPSLPLPTLRREPVPSDNEETWGGRLPRVCGLLEARRWPEGSSALGVRAAAFPKLQRDGLKGRKKDRGAPFPRPELGGRGVPRSVKKVVTFPGPLVLTCALLTHTRPGKNKVGGEDTQVCRFFLANEA